jgi:uncharacterized membrane protein (Fun14 family)
MIDTTITQTLVPFAGSGFLGYICGFFLKKILKWIMIICGTILGAFFCGLLALQAYGYIGQNAIKWNKLGDDLYNSAQSWTKSVINNNSTGNNISINAAHSLIHNIGLPITSGLAIGLLAGLIRTK